ncbi:MAG: Hsp20/alpha crystallin family protein [Exilibacterium sp.]
MSLIPRSSFFDFDNFFDQFWGPSRRSPEVAEMAFSPRVEVKEAKDSYLINAELPGIEKKDINVTLDNGILTIEAESQQEDIEEKKGKVIRQERRYGKYMRSFNLGSNVQDSKIDASFNNGVLTVKAPKTQPSVDTSHRIAIH